MDRMSIAGRGLTIATLARWAIALVGLVLVVRLGIWVVTGAGSGWPPEEHYAGARLYVLALGAAPPIVGAIIGGAILLIPWRLDTRWQAVLMTVTGVGFVLASILVAIQLVGLEQLVPA